MSSLRKRLWAASVLDADELEPFCSAAMTSAEVVEPVELTVLMIVQLSVSGYWPMARVFSIRLLAVPIMSALV